MWGVGGGGWRGQGLGAVAGGNHLKLSELKRVALLI